MELLLFRANPADLVELLHADESRPTSVALRKDERPASEAPRICLVTSSGRDVLETVGEVWQLDAAAEYLVAITISKAAGSVTSTQKRFVFDPVLVLDPPLPIVELSNQIAGSGSKSNFDHAWRGKLPPKTSEDVWTALLELSPEYRDDLERLARTLWSPTSLPPESLDVLSQERDAVVMAVEIFDPVEQRSPRNALRAPELESTEAPFLSRLASSHQLEDQVISADSRHFMKWLVSETAHASAISFASGPRRLTIVNANKAGLERATGADLIYYHHGVGSFVLVQYKMLERKSREWVYYPDAQFAKELKRLDQVENLSASDSYDPKDHLSYRIGPPVTYFKFCRRNTTFDPNDASMLKGFYVPALYVEPLMASMTPAGKGKRLTDNGLRPRSLNSGSFARLVSTGFIGTRGSTTALLSDTVRASLELGHSVVAAFEEFDDAWKPPAASTLSPLGDLP